MQKYNEDLAAIRQMMERSSKFISLSGASGILAGIYSMIGAWLASDIIYGSTMDEIVVTRDEVGLLSTIAVGVIILTAFSAVLLTAKKAKRKGQSIWTGLSMRVLTNLAIPLVTGGLAAVFLLLEGYYDLIAPVFLIFYGMALVNASHLTVRDVRWLGICEIVLGLACMAYLDYGLVFWSLGFGILNIVYGAVMYVKYDMK